MAAGRPDYTLDKVLAHLFLDAHHRAVGSAQFDAEHLGCEASFLPFAFLPDVAAKDGTGTDEPPSYNCRNSPLASEDSCSRAYRDLLS